MKSMEFVNKAIDIAKNHKTLYVMGCFGAPLTGVNVTRYLNNHSYNKQASRQKMIKAAANQSPPVFGFDCVCLMKGIMWGWNGDASRTYGGAGYAINGVPDVNADGMIARCTGVTSNFSNIIPGECVWMAGHVGIYIGNGLAVECSPAFQNKVQITAVGNIGKKAGYSTRTWTKHGKIPWIDYTDQSGTSTTTPAAPSTPTTTTPSTGSLKVGDIVDFTGRVHYSNANAATGPACKPGKAKVTSISKNGKHPYHLIAVKGAGSTVYGWVDVKDIKGAAAPSVLYNIQITCTALNIRNKAGTANGGTAGTTVVGCIRDRNTYGITKVENGWGYLADGRGWIYLSYTKKV